MADDEDLVLFNATREGVAVITLNRPRVHNAFNPDVINKLNEICADLRNDADRIRVVLIEGAGPSFSAGADLAWMRAAADYTPHDNREDAEPEPVRRAWRMIDAILIGLRHLLQAECASIVLRSLGGIRRGHTNLPG